MFHDSAGIALHIRQRNNVLGELREHRHGPRAACRRQCGKYSNFRLLEGHGLVFNPGERVEGYSNFLWALELAAIWKLFGLVPEAVAQWLSVGYTAGVLAVLVLPGIP